MGQLYAIKEMKFDKMRPRDIEMAVKEAEKMRSLNHKNIIQYIAHFKNDADLVYIASEFANMGDLAGALSTQRTLEKNHGEPRWPR